MQVVESIRMSRKEYMELSGDTPQNLANKIRCGSVKLVKTREMAEVEKIELTPDQYNTILKKRKRK